MRKSALRIVFVTIAAVWMFLLGIMFIYSKKLSVKTSFNVLDFQTENRQIDTIPNGIQITKPGVKGSSFESVEYVSLAGKHFSLRSKLNIVPAENEIVYMGNGDDQNLKDSLINEFNEMVSEQNDEEFKNLKNPSVMFSDKASDSKNEDYLIVGSLEFLMGNCNFYNSTDIRIDPDSQKLSVGEIAKKNLCVEYQPPATPKLIECGSNCDLAPVDKNNSLSPNYIPSVVTVDFIPGGFQIKDSVYPYLREMFIAAQNDGVKFKLTSTYRSYDMQKGTFDGWVQYEMALGRSYEAAVAEASTYSALPGHSEHQLGTTADINSGECSPFVAACPDNDRVWQWLANNAHKFGFVMSYQPYKEHLTGYVYEPWHYRWIGVELATLYKEKYEGISYSTEFLRNVSKFMSP